MAKYIMQHWHFYQPRKNDRWTRDINKQCYRPNSENGILRHVSYNIGPTLLDWFRKNDPETLERMVNADNGQAIAQAYSHRILPLARYDEDIKTQIIWGKKHFKSFFGREAEGMWLPETATSKRVCRGLAKEGIKYTIGAPWQQKDVHDTSRPYRIGLGDSMEMIYLFYNDVTAKIAFNDPGMRLLDNADRAMDWLANAAKDGELLFLAYDAETFGHHHKLADMWAAHFPKAAEKREDVNIITPDEYIRNFEIKDNCDIWDDSSWSCLCGGLKRWTTGCGCGGGYRMYQEPMLKALEKIEDGVHEVFEDEAGAYFRDVWDARNDHIGLRLGNLDWGEFFRRHLKDDVSKEKKDSLKQLLKAEYHTQLSFTSCGWFFADLSVQAEYNMLDSYLAADIIKNTAGRDMTAGLLQDLENVEDWILEDGQKMRVTGRELLEKRLKAKRI